MTKKIAVYVGAGGETSSLYEKGKVVLYSKKPGRWEVLKEKEFSPGRHLNMQELRHNMAEILEFIGDGRIFVGLSVTGIPYFELEKSGFSVWEFQGKPLDYLDYVLEKEEEETNKKIYGGETLKPPAPVEISDGCYRISIKEIQENNHGVTSKQALLPFLRHGEFYSLQILCNHVPPWLESELLAGSLNGLIEQIDKDSVRVTITRNGCI